MSISHESRLWEIVENAAEYVTDDDGRFLKKDLEDELLERLTQDDLDPHIRSTATRKLAQGLVRGFGERRSPKRRRTSSMFHPRRILKLGNGIWVWMDVATSTDLIEWGRLSTRNLARVENAEFDRQSYVDERVDAFRDHTGLVLLGELERIVFGYADDPGVPPDTEDDE